jgi:hypothetical protein
MIRAKLQLVDLQGFTGRRGPQVVDAELLMKIYFWAKRNAPHHKARFYPIPFTLNQLQSFQLH